MSKSIARQRSEIASERSIWPCLRPSFKENSTFSSCDKIFAPLDLWLQNFIEHLAWWKSSLVYLLCFLKVWFRSDEPILSTSHLKTYFATHSFDHNGPAFNPPPLLLYELSCSYGSSRALRVMCEVHCASAQRNRF